jgi:NAD(P)-dependent dehydrogenase (short-subunit alcohol dehydrogenase family)
VTKHIVLTGGSSGIGFELLKRLLEKEYRVAVVVRTREQSDELQNNFRSEHLEVFIADLSVQSEVSNVCRLIAEKLVRVDVLFNNAAVMLEKIITSQQGNEMHYEVNTLSPYLFMQGLKSALMKSPDPLIVNTATDGLHQIPNIKVDVLLRPGKDQSTLGIYLYSKLAILLLMKYMSEELRQNGIRVMHVSPGGNKTKMSMGSGMPAWLKPVVWLFYKHPRHGAGLLYNAAFGEEHSGKTQVYLQNNKVKNTHGSITAEQASDLMSGLK